jgi:hypothetical protein
MQHDPHLHFGAARMRGNDPTMRPMDPYGWSSAAPDPWASDTAGIGSVAIWTDARAPKLYGERRLVGFFNAGFTVGFPTIRFWGVRDSTNANNEFIDVQANPSNTAALDMGGWRLTNLAGDRYTFPAGAQLAPGATIRVYSGADANTATTLYWGRTSGALDDLADCLILRDANGAVMFNAFWGGAACSPL